MTINLTRFYELMEADYQRMMEVVEAGPYAAHPDVLKIKALNPSTLFEKGKKLESIAGRIGFRNPGAVLILKSEGEEVDRLTKLIEKTVTTEITHPILKKAMLRFLIKYVSYVNEDFVAPKSEVIRLRFVTKKNEIAHKFIKMREMLSIVSNIEEIPGIIEALKEDQEETEQQEAEFKKAVDLLESEQTQDKDAFEVVIPLRFNKCLDVFKGVEGQADYFLYQFFFKEASDLWENENNVVFDAPATNKSLYPVKKVNNDVLKNELQCFVINLLDTNPALKKVWEGEKTSIFQQLWPISENQKKCQKMAMALYFKSIYAILDGYESEVKNAYQQYHHTCSTQEYGAVKIKDITSLLFAFGKLFVSGTSRNQKSTTSWASHVEKCENLFRDTNQKLMLANAGILDKLEEYGFDRTKPVTPISQMFLNLNQNIEEMLNPTFDDEPQWGLYHPLYAESQIAVEAALMPPHEVKKKIHRASSP